MNSDWKKLALFPSGYPDLRLGMFDGHWVSQLENMILALLPSFSDFDKIEACNELADAEGLNRLDADDQDIDFWIYQSFINPVLDMLVETGAPNKQSEATP